MNGILKRAAAAALAVIMGASGAFAYTTPDFSDVAAGNWAYSSVMQMADAGIIKGTSASTFAPELKVSAAMWLTLVGRAVYEADVKSAAQTGDNWYNAYVRVAESKGLLSGTDITQVGIEGEISRYDMAVTLYGAVKLLGVKDAIVDTSKITDYGNIPTEYTSAVSQVYAQGLITGDSQGNFNGTNTMRRDESATVMARLLELKGKLEGGSSAPTEPEVPEGKTETFTITGKTFRDGNLRDPNPANWEIPMANVELTLYYIDGRVLGTTTSKADGTFSITVTVAEKDYTKTGNVYFFNAIGVETSAGKTYANDVKGTSNLASCEFLGGWDVPLWEISE